MVFRFSGRTIRAATLTLALVSPLASARAAIVQYTYSGTVDYGYDRAGIFGQNESLTGQSFTLIERFDTVNTAFRYIDAAQSFQFGGSTREAAHSASLTVTIGGSRRSINDHEDYIYSGSETGKHLDFVKDQSGYEYAGFYVSSPMMMADYGTAFSLDASQATFIGNYQYFDTANSALSTYASFNVQQLTVNPISPVPLPGGLPLFGASLLVFAGVGVLLRRKRSA